jgi:hypothetical protein
MSEKVMFKDSITLNYGDTIADIMERIPSGVAPHEIYIEYDHEERFVALSYTRLETDAEMQKRIEQETRFKETRKNREIQQLKYLISIHGIPE